MSLIAQEIKELRSMVKDCNDIENLTARIETKLKIYKETHKREKITLDMLIACNKPHIIESRMHDLNWISKGEYMQVVGDIETEMVMCPDQDKAISREMCLSFSGDEKNNANCSSCKNYKITRQLLLPKKQ